MEAQPAFQRPKRMFVPHSKFSQVEDDILRSAVAFHGIDNWASIAGLVEGKTERQCKERWFNYVNPSLKAGSWTPEEDERLLAKHEQHGNKWMKIARFFPNRTDGMLKNRFWRLQRQAHKQRRIAEKLAHGKASLVTSAVNIDDIDLSVSNWEDSFCFPSLDRSFTFDGHDTCFLDEL
jgi:hypothetical protein